MSDKLCKNCWMPKSPKAFHATTDGYTDVCRACAYTVRRSLGAEVDGYRPPFNDEISRFDKKFPRSASQVSREVEKYYASFLSGHWEVSLLYLGRITEALVYALADAFGLKSQLPLNANLARIEQSQASIRNRLSEAMAKGEMKGVEIAAMQKQLKELVNAALDLNSELSQFEVPTDYEVSKDYNFVLKLMEKHFLVTGKRDAVELLRSSINPKIRTIMDARNHAAHSPFDGKRRTIRKRHVVLQAALLSELITDLANLPNSDGLKKYIA